jgi:superfamily II DNA or RNA helicase
MERINLKIPFDRKDEAKKSSEVNGRNTLRWDPELKTWYFNPTSAQPTLPAALKKFLPTPLKEQTWVLEIPFEYRAFASKAGAKWNAKWRSTTYTGTILPLELTGFEAQDYSWEQWVQRELNGQTSGSIKDNQFFRARPHQVTGIKTIVKAFKQGRAPGFLLADDLGLGKTITSWRAIQEILPSHKTYNIAIICPLAVRAAWIDSIKAMGHGPWNILVTTYDRLRQLFDESKSKTKIKTRKGVAKNAPLRPWDFIVWDESHRLRNLESARSKQALSLYSGKARHLWLSATAGQQPLELGYLLPLLKHLVPVPKESTALKTFQSLCKNLGLKIDRKYGRFQWEECEEDSQTMHNILYKPKNGITYAIRRRPEEIAGWPEKQRILQPVELTQEKRRKYNLAWEEFKAELANKSAPRINKDGSKRKFGIVEITRFLQKASILRCEHTVELALDLLDNGHKVAISCRFLDSLAKIQEGLEKAKIKVVTIHGKTPDKEAERLHFQKGDAQVVIFTVVEGINLHQGQLVKNDLPRAQIDHDLRWVSIEVEQIDGRCHRDGRFAKIYWLYGHDTKEHNLAERMLSKMKSMNTLSGDKLNAIDELIDILS